MMRRGAICACLVFSGLTALVYQIVWVRLLGLTFGTTTEAVSTVLAIFFGGLALGNLFAGLRLVRVRRPLRVYAWLELGIGVYALASLPLLRALDALYLWPGVASSDTALALARVAAAALVLLPPTVAMGATLPVVARGLVTEDSRLGRWSGYLYASNTLGAVIGAYLCGFWLLPGLGLTRTVIGAGCVNLAVALAVLAVARGRGPLPNAPVPARLPVRLVRRRALFLACFGASGFVAIGYEILWSKVFGIVMEGTLYGFAAVLSAVLLGIALGSLAVAPFVDRIRDLPRTFGLLHVAIAVCVLLGVLAVPDLPYFFQELARSGSGDAVHLLYLLVLPIVALPMALFGAAFPVLIRIYTSRASGAGRGIGIATAVNTAGSIVASFAVGFWWIPRLGMDGSLALLVGLDAVVALTVLAAFQESRGPKRIAVLAGSALVLLVSWLPYEGVRVDRAVVGRAIQASSLADYRTRLARELATQVYSAEGRNSVVTVYVQQAARYLRTNGLPEAGYTYQPPYYPSESMLLGILPYLTAGAPHRGLLVGLGGGNSLDSLLQTHLEQIDVVELEPEVVDALGVFRAGRPSPLDDPRVRLVVNDGRNELLRALYDGRPAYDVIASQPSHPWRVGAANLFTEEYFRLARANLSEDGRFALWINGFRMSREALLAIVASFERVFPGAQVADISHGMKRSAFLLLGGLTPVEIDPTALAERMREPGTAGLLRGFELDTVEALLGVFEGPAAAFAAMASHDANTDDDAFVETSVPRQLVWSSIDFSAIEAALPAEVPVLPPTTTPLDVAEIARHLLAADEQQAPWPHARKLERLLAAHGESLDPVVRETLLATARLRNPARVAEAEADLAVLAAEHPDRPEPWRTLGEYRARTGQYAAAASAFSEAHARSGSTGDAVAAGLAWSAVDLDRAQTWFDRVPASERGAYPELAVFAARRALERGARDEELRSAYVGLRDFRNTREGRAHPGIDELLARLAFAIGDLPAARGHVDLARAERREQGAAALARARGALAAGRIDLATAAFEEAARLLPADAAVLDFRGRLALARRDPEGLAAAMRELRAWSPSFGAGILAENRFREQNHLPLLPPVSLDELLEGPDGDGNAGDGPPR